MGRTGARLSHTLVGMSAKPSSAEVMALRKALHASLEGIDEGETVIVACSGGPDSLALAATLAWAAPRHRITVVAIIVDHGLQDGSAEIAEQAAGQCQAMGVAARVVRVEVGTDGGPEMAARTARYAALEQAARELGAIAIMLGHTRDDQAESVLLGLAQGSGARSIAGMRPVQGLLRRPFLVLDRATVHAAARELVGDAWQDPHNEDARFARVRVRQAMATLEEAIGPGIAAALARTADLVRDDADALDAMADAVPVNDDGSVDVAVLDALPRAVRTRVLRRMAMSAGSDPRALGFEHVSALDALLTQWRGQGPLDLPSGVRAERAHGRITVHAPR